MVVVYPRKKYMYFEGAVAEYRQPVEPDEFSQEHTSGCSQYRYAEVRRYVITWPQNLIRISGAFSRIIPY